MSDEAEMNQLPTMSMTIINHPSLLLITHDEQ
jgi:hypothetical protein